MTIGKGFPGRSNRVVTVHGLLGDGVAASTRSDPQARSLGELLHARLVDIPRGLLAG